MSQKIRDLDDLREFIGYVLKDCVKDGMAPPYLLCSLSPKGGNVAIMRVRGDGTSEVLAEHYDNPDMFLLPMTIAILDQENRAVRIVINAEGRVSRH